jgi:hypothetical protein
VAANHLTGYASLNLPYNSFKVTKFSKYGRDVASLTIARNQSLSKYFEVGVYLAG